MLKQTVKEALILVLAAVGIALAVYSARPDKIGSPQAAVDDGSDRQVPSEGGVAEISLEEALHRFEEKSAIFADARHAADFDAGHIKAAVHLYAADQDAWLSRFLSATDPLALIVTYCDGDDCHLATQLAELLYLNGFENVRFLKNGWTRWRERGFPVE